MFGEIGLSGCTIRSTSMLNRKHHPFINRAKEVLTSGSSKNEILEI